MRLVLLGAPGAGKGTQAQALSERFNIPHISTGEIFRTQIENGTLMGKKANEYISKGLLVPDEITIKIIKEILKKDYYKQGFILDGFPRTIAQGEALDKILSLINMELDFVINIYVSDAQIIERLSGRRVCEKCGKSYHIKYKPPIRKEMCDDCNIKLTQRNDDKEDTIKRRIKTYHLETEPLIDYYSEKGILLTVESQEKIEDTTGEVMRLIGDM